MAQAATRDGIGVGDRIAFLDRNGIAYFDFLFGGSLIGAVNVAVNWRLAPAEMAAIIDDSAAPVLAIHSDYLPALADMPSALPSVRTSSSSATVRTRVPTRGRVSFERVGRGCPAEDPGHVGAPDEVSMQLYTSGTTGLPKGVMLTNANLSTADRRRGRDLPASPTTRSAWSPCPCSTSAVRAGRCAPCRAAGGRSSCATSIPPYCSS